MSSQILLSGATRSARLLLVALATAAAAGAAAPAPVAAQGVDLVPPSLLQEVMPAASRFAPAEGEPPVRRAYREAAAGEILLGYVFLTSDLPPERFGYSGPIEALIGMDGEGTLTGVRVLDYYESYRSSMGDFLRRPGFQEQFAGKHIADAFHVGDDVDGISRVSISVRALSRGVRDAARKVAAAYAAGPELPTAVVPDPGTLSWFEMRQVGLIERMEVTEPGEGSVGISVVYLGSDRVGARLLGEDLHARALEAIERRGGADHLVLYGLDGARLRLFVREGWSWLQGPDTVGIEPADIVNLGLPSGGLVATEATLVGLMILDGPLDVARPFTLRYEPGPGLGVHSVEYVTSEARLATGSAARTIPSFACCATRRCSIERLPLRPGAASASWSSCSHSPRRPSRRSGRAGCAGRRWRRPSPCSGSWTVASCPSRTSPAGSGWAPPSTSPTCRFSCSSGSPS